MYFLYSKIRPVALAFVLLAGAAWAQSSASAQVAPSGEQRKTSEPYTGDLSIFDSAGREERLQINRVMDILGITAGKSVGDLLLQEPRGAVEADGEGHRGLPEGGGAESVRLMAAAL